jgi:hypothetical protein
MFLFPFDAFAKIEDVKYNKFVLDFQDRIKNDKTEELSEHIKYPLLRAYPLKPIENKNEFIKRYHEIFDEKQKEFFLRVSPNEDLEDEKFGRTYWGVSREGTIMLKRDLIASFIDFDLSGNLIQITSSDKENANAKLLKKNNTNLHDSLKNFNNLQFIIQTEKFLVRIDHIEKSNYRYASWSNGKSMSNEPDLILENGQCNPAIIETWCWFYSGNIEYSARVFNEGASSTYLGGALEVSKNGEVILEQDAEVKSPSEL